MLLLMIGLAAVASLQAAAGAQPPTTTTLPTNPSDIGAMEWVQSLREDPAFAGFMVEQSTIVVARVPGRDFLQPMPPNADSVEFVDASLSHREFRDGREQIIELLQQMDPIVVGVSYDPFVDEMVIRRQPGTVGAAIEPSIVGDALVAAFGTAAEGVGHRYAVEESTIRDVPGIDPGPATGRGEIVSVTVLCEEDRLVSVSETPGGNAGRWSFWPRPGQVSGQEFGTAWDWSCRVATPDTSGADRLIYTLLTLVAVLIAGLIWVLSMKSDLERQLWAVRNPKSQAPI